MRHEGSGAMRDFDWQIIVTLEKTRSITKTSEMLYIAQPTLTKRIQLIEEELGIQLLLRSRKGSEFTPEGKNVAQHAAKIVQAIQDAKNDIAARNSGAKCTIRVGTPASYARYFIPKLLARYVERYPDVEIDLITALSNELAENVEYDALDVCFARFNTADTFLERMLVSEDQVYAAYAKPFELEELGRLPFVDFNKNPAIIAATQRWWGENFKTPLIPNFKVPTGDIAAWMVQYGLGFSIFPDEKYFKYDKNLYSIPLVFEDGSNFIRKTWLLYKKESLKNPAVKNFVEMVESWEHEE